MPSVFISWKSFTQVPVYDVWEVDSSFGVGFAPVYTSEEECRRYHPGVKVVEVTTIDESAVSRN